MEGNDTQVGLYGKMGADTYLVAGGVSEGTLDAMEHAIP